MPHRPTIAARAAVALLAGLGLAALAPAVSSAAPEFRSRLPIVVIDTAGPIVDDPKMGGRMRIVDGRGLNTPAGRPSAYDGRIGIEVRGQSSQRFPKKQFGLETVDARGEGRDVSLLGLPADDDWVLYAGYNDGTMMRNVVAYDAARRMGRYASRTRYVEVVLNGSYWGVYVLMERLELGADRVREPEGRDGALLEYTHPTKLDPGDGFFRTAVTKTPIVYADPERGDLTRARARQLARRVNSFERALYGPGFRHPTRGWRAHMDADSAVDYVLLHELMVNHDAFSASTFMHEGEDGRLVMGPQWDFDLSMGNPPDLLPPRGAWLTNRRWVTRLYRDQGFVDAMERRWTQLRRQGFVRRTLAGIRRDALALATPQVRNLRAWPVVGAYARPVDGGAPEAALRAVTRAEVAALERWIGVRSRWLSANVGRLGRLR